MSNLFWQVIDWIWWIAELLFHFDREMRSGAWDTDSERGRAKRRPPRRVRSR
jgi:hypothetical protein